MKPILTAVILTHNEEKNIKACIKSVAFADEILVIDDNSTDNTVRLAKQMHAIVYQRKLDDFASQRNFALTKVTGEWVLFVDADERVTPELAHEIEEVITKKSFVYQIPRKNNIFGKFFAFTNWYPDLQTRLFKVGNANYQRKVHEQIVTKDPIAQLSSEFIHQNYDTVDQFITKNFITYAALEAKHLVQEGYVFDWKDLIRKPVGEFLSRFFKAEGYKDGIHGFIASVLVAVAVFVAYVKVWEIQGSNTQPMPLHELEEQFEKSVNETDYWFTKSRISLEKNKIKRLFLKLTN